MRIAIIGQGYVGTAIGLAASRAGHQVIGIEIDAAKVKMLETIGYPVTAEYSKVEGSEIVILAVPTPLNAQREPDITYIEQACLNLKPYLSPKTLVINESTSFPGTVREVIAPLLGNELLFASAPERVDPANEQWDVTNTPRIVGGLTEEASEKAFDFYRSVSNVVLKVSSPEVAEAAKLFENTFRQVNIALVNEFAQIANVLGLSTFETLNAAATKPYGFMKFLPSVGVGGHCIPIDPSYLSFKARNAGLDAKFINLANNVNLNMPYYIASRIDNEFGISGKSIQIAGISYKANVSDIRESPSLSLIEILRSKGAEVTWHDKYVSFWNGEKSTSIQSVDIGIICTAHSNVDYSPWNNNTKVIDISPSEFSGFKKYL